MADVKRWYCIVGGRQYGPVDEETFRAWAGQGRVQPDDSVWSDGMAGWRAASSIRTLAFGGPPGAAGGPAPAFVKAHRGGTVLVFAVLGLLCCPVAGIAAWVLARGDLEEMDAGEMDPGGRALTRAAEVLGMVGVAAACAGVIVQAAILLAVALK